MGQPNKVVLKNLVLDDLEYILERLEEKNITYMVEHIDVEFDTRFYDLIIYATSKEVKKMFKNINIGD